MGDNNVPQVCVIILPKQNFIVYILLSLAFLAQHHVVKFRTELTFFMHFVAGVQVQAVRESR